MEQRFGFVLHESAWDANTAAFLRRQRSSVDNTYTISICLLSERHHCFDVVEGYFVELSPCDTVISCRIGRVAQATEL